jgi:integrase
MTRRIDNSDVGNWSSKVPVALSPTLDVAGVMKLYLDKLEREDSPSLYDARTNAARWIIPAFGSYLVADLRVPHVVAWVQHLSSMGLAPKSTRKIHTFLRAALELARGAGLIAANPAARLPPGALPPNETRPGFDAAAELLTLEQMIALIEDKRLPLGPSLLWALLAFAGLRFSEAIVLTFGDIDFNAEPLPSLEVSKAWNVKLGRIHTTKTNQVRLVPIHRDLLLPLILEMRDGCFERTFKRPPTSEDLILAYQAAQRSKRRGPIMYNNRSALRHWRKALKLHGHSPRRLHSLRHFFDTVCCEAGAHIEAVEAITHPPKRQRQGVHRYIHATWQARCSAVSALQRPSSKVIPIR